MPPPAPGYPEDEPDPLPRHAASTKAAVATVVVGPRRLREECMLKHPKNFPPGCDYCCCLAPCAQSKMDVREKAGGFRSVWDETVGACESVQRFVSPGVFRCCWRFRLKSRLLQRTAVLLCAIVCFDKRTRGSSSQAELEEFR